MIFEHYATRERIKVKLIVDPGTNEIIVENLETNKLMVVSKDKNNRMVIKGTSFIMKNLK